MHSGGSGVREYIGGVAAYIFSGGVWFLNTIASYQLRWCHFSASTTTNASRR